MWNWPGSMRIPVPSRRDPRSRTAKSARPLTVSQSWFSDLRAELEVVAELTRKCIVENSSNALNQEEYLARYTALEQRYEGAKSRLETMLTRKAEREAKADQIGAFMFELAERDEPITEFDDRLWLAVIDTVTAHADGRLVFKFQNGTEVTA